ncbi:MAG: KGG domain-containing protein [Vicinamibacteraceae bacterium]
MNDELKTPSATMPGEPVRRKERRGFASMSREKQREIASKGGRMAHLKGTAHEWTPDEARVAGRKGGMVSRGGRGRLMSPGEEEDATQGSAGQNA